MAERTMVIGWDSSDFDLLAPWVEKGYMPNLKKLMDNSRWGKLSSVYPPQTANAWSTIVTGKNSGKHGIFDFMQFKPNSYDFFPINATNRAAKDVWEILSENGRRVVVVGVPLTYPIRHVNGYMISGFMTPNESVDYSYPLGLKDEIKLKIPGYTVNPSQVYEGDTNDEDYVKLLFDVLKKHIEGAEYLARNKEWDFFMAVFNETDWCLHRFWSTLDPNHPQYSLSRAQKYGAVIRDVHVRLDSALGVLLDIAGSDTNVILLSDHGSGPLYKIMNINAFLHKIGKLKLKRRPGTFLRYALAKTGLSPMNLLAKSKKYKISKSISPSKMSKSSNILNKFFITKRDIDWSRTEAFALFGIGQIFLNRVGSFPNGIVSESNYMRVSREITEELKRLKDENHDNIVQSIYRKEELFKGPNLEKGPDILFYSVSKYLPMGTFSYGATDLLSHSLIVSGTHQMHGMVVLRQPEFRTGEKRIEDASLVDIVPTILHLMKVPAPSDLDGRTLSDSKDTLILSRKTEEKYESQRTQGLTKEEEADIEERLRSLGYI